MNELSNNEKRQKIVSIAQRLLNKLKPSLGEVSERSCGSENEQGILCHKCQELQELTRLAELLRQDVF